MNQFKGDEIVISGISGCFPEAVNIQELRENLYGKVDMISKYDEFSHIKHPELPKYAGKIKNMEKFDSQLFRVTQWQATTLDPVARKLMEQTYCAIFDAGINPETLKGTKMGVFVNFSQSDAGTLSLYNIFKNNGFVISGCSKAMSANRISYWIDAKGPSYSLDNGCVGSIAALEMAFNRMKAGEIDCAVVGGSNFNVHPIVTVNMKRAGLLCLDGKTKCFDKQGDGYVRSDAINVLFLQKAKDAKRIYLEVYHVKGKYFGAPDATFLPTRNPKDLEKFFNEFYSEVDTSPEEVEYVEANAFGIAEADGNELEAIGNVFGKSKTVKIGSVKSNMGNTEAASGACSVTKLCLAYQFGKIPANLHYNEPQNHIKAVREGKLQVVTEHAAFKRKFTAINSFCFTGDNYHTLLKGHYKPKDTQRYKSPIPRLVLLSGRHEDSVNKILDVLEKNPIDQEQCALLGNFFKYNVSGFTGRGYTILDENENKETVSLSRGFEFYSGNTRPLWFLYSGMGSQWAGMGEGLLRLPVFAAAIEKCNKVLLPHGFDLIKIITDKNNENMDILKSLVAITAIQIGLTDVLKSLKIVPDNIIGHSVGELGSAYADGSLTAEQTILASYSRAMVSFETKFIKGKMAAVGLGHKEVAQICPPEIEVACHNSSQSATISGPSDIVTKFVKMLTEQGIFAKEVATSNIAFHSRYIAKAGPEMLALQKQFITDPKPRSKKWLSTCFPPEDWHKPESQYASPEYFTHNLLSSVLFEEAARLIPDDAIILEIAPHGLLQAIMKRSHSQCINLSLTRRGQENSVKLFLETVARLYQNGLNPDVEELYPKVEFPVSTETPPLSHLMDFEHSVDWPEDKYEMEGSKITTSKEFLFSIHDDDYAILKDHVRNGVNVLPEAAIIVFTWETLAEYKVINYRDLTVEFDDVKFYREVIIAPNKVIKVNVTIQRSSGRFEVVNEESVVADGFIKYSVNTNEKRVHDIMLNENEQHLNQNDIYTVLSHKGYSYEGKFKCIKSTNIEKNKGVINWNKQWITFLSAIIQLTALSKNHEGVSTVKLINKLTINVEEHSKLRSITNDGEQSYNAIVLRDTGDTMCGGVTLEDILFNHIPIIENEPEVLHTLKFVPHISMDDYVDIETALHVNLQIIYENTIGEVIKILETAPDIKTALSSKIKEIAKKIPVIKVEIETLQSRLNKGIVNDYGIDTGVLIFHDLLKKNELIQELPKVVTENTFILTIENGLTDATAIKCVTPVTAMRVKNQSVILLKKTVCFDISNIITMPLQTDPDLSILKSKKILEEQKKHVLLLNEQYHQSYNAQGLHKKIKNHKKLSMFTIDANASMFSTSNNFYIEQVKKNLKVNTLKNGKWGTYCYIPFSTKNHNVKNIKLISKEPGNFSSLSWIEHSVNFKKHSIKVCCAGLSSKDSNNFFAAEDNTCFGMDYSGFDSRGNRVMGLLPKGALASTVEADYDLLWPIPQNWSMEEAATVPLPYIHAFYCLCIRGSLERNSNLFINGAAGALGQAVISIALSQGCTVFATVGSMEKKILLMKLFPELNECNIGNTYDIAFRDMVITRTKNKRCSIVINCGSGMTRKATMNCVGAEKYFLDVCENDCKNNEKFTMSYLWEMKSYSVVNMSNIFSEINNKTKKKLKFLLADGISQGFVRPLTSVVYAPSDVARAFRLLSCKNNRGRVLINMNSHTLTDTLEVIPRLTLSSTKTYIVISDGTEYGVELINRLIQRGARRFIIHYGAKLMNGVFYANYALWTKLDVRVEFSSDDLQMESTCQNLFKNAEKVGPVDGIFIIQSPIKETSCEIDQELQDILSISSNLDKVSRNYNELRYFVIIAAISCNVSNEYALCEIERHCLMRNELGLPSLFLRHILYDKKQQPTTLFNGMESSLQQKCISVITSDLIDNKIKSQNITHTNFYGGLAAFFNHILEDEFTATEAIVQLKTEKGYSYEHELLINPDDTHLLMIPGLEGHHKALSSISERLKATALALQLVPNMNYSIPEMAKTLLTSVKMRLQLKSPFHIMGYSFGVNVALEMAALLEKEGLVGVIYCLDSSPDAMRVHLDAYMGKLTDEQLQNYLLEHFFKLLAGRELRTEFRRKLNKTTSWSEKKDMFISEIKNCITHTHQYLTDLLQAAYDRIQMAKEYKPKFNLESELVLIKGIPHPNADHLSDDYNLSQYTNKPVHVYDIPSDHALAPMDCKVTNYINRIL